MGHICLTGHSCIVKYGPIVERPKSRGKGRVVYVARSRLDAVLYQYPFCQDGTAPHWTDPRSGLIALEKSALNAE